MTRRTGTDDIQECVLLSLAAEYTRAEVTEALKKLNGGKDAEYVLNYRKADGKRTTARVWRVPAFEETDVELDVKEIPNDIPF